MATDYRKVLTRVWFLLILALCTGTSVIAPKLMTRESEPWLVFVYGTCFALNLVMLNHAWESKHEYGRWARLVFLLVAIDSLLTIGSPPSSLEERHWWLCILMVASYTYMLFRYRKCERAQVQKETP